MPRQLSLDETAAPLVPDRPSLKNLSTRRSRTPASTGARSTSPTSSSTRPHFKWQARGKRRIHQKPNWSEITACRPWLDAELEVIEPRVLVCLGATAAQALLGRDFRVSRQRGELVESELAENVIATVHPSSILRADEATREQEYRELVRDLEKVAALI